mmetsp:Transcript_41511/g.134007  ORF Transcript_41511/g.134007 Transcript_41511/m.134007 type:complete len:262 (-) Transcript_41511:17-802(-)
MGDDPMDMSLLSLRSFTEQPDVEFAGAAAPYPTLAPSPDPSLSTVSIGYLGVGGGGAGSSEGGEAGEGGAVHPMDKAWDLDKITEEPSKANKPGRSWFNPFGKSSKHIAEPPTIDVVEVTDLSLEELGCPTPLASASAAGRLQTLSAVGVGGLDASPTSSGGSRDRGGRGLGTEVCCAPGAVPSSPIASEANSCVGIAGAPGRRQHPSPVGIGWDLQEPRGKPVPPTEEPVSPRKWFKPMVVKQSSVEVTPVSSFERPESP